MWRGRGSAEASTSEPATTNPANNMARGGNEPAPSQRCGCQACTAVALLSPDRAPLPTARVVSSIPIGDVRPKHQAGAAGACCRGAGEVLAESLWTATWTYPSEQMFFNAMLRKGWSPREEDMHRRVAAAAELPGGADAPKAWWPSTTP